MIDRSSFLLVFYALQPNLDARSVLPNLSKSFNNVPQDDSFSSIADFARIDAAESNVAAVTLDFTVRQ